LKLRSIIGNYVYTEIIYYERFCIREIQNLSGLKFNGRPAPLKDSNSPFSLKIFKKPENINRMSYHVMGSLPGYISNTSSYLSWLAHHPLPLSGKTSDSRHQEPCPNGTKI